MDAKRNKNGRGLFSESAPFTPKTPPPPRALCVVRVCCRPLSQGATEKGREERAQGEVLLMNGRASSKGALGLKRGRESVRSEVSPLDEERRVVGGCVGVEKGKGECAVRGETS